MCQPRRLHLPLLGVSMVAMASFAVAGAHAQTPPIVVSSNLPSELNPPFAAGPPSSGGAPAATPAQAAAFAWQEFIALNWPAGPQQGQNNQREAPSSSCKFGDPGSNCSLLVWETLRGKVEIFPGDGNPPPGYTGSTAATSWGYDQTPVYNYGAPIPACDTSQAGDATPWINLDETDEITLANMYAGNAATASSTGNSAPTLIRFLAKANRTQYVYVAGNSNPKNPLKQWWSAIPSDVVQATKNYLMQNQASPPPGSSTMVSQPYGTVEAKAGWRPLTDSEKASGRFHMQTVRFYEQGSGTPCYRDDVWGLVALHIIQKTPSAPYFIYATFEQADNILTADGKAVEDADGKIVLPQTTATTPQVCLNDPQPPSTPPPAQEITSQLGQVILTSDPASCQPLTTANYCGAPGKQLYYRNAAFPPTNNQPSAGNICVDQRDNAIPDYVITANAAAHSAITSYLNSNSIPSAPWLAYKLINVQYYPYDKIPNPNTPNASPYTAQPPFTATNPAPSSYYQANIVVETNRSLQLFAGGLSPNIATEWNADGTPHKNTYYGGGFHNMGGCMGCHGSQGQNPGGQAGDFSVILARGAVTLPEVPATESGPALSATHRNRKLSR